MALLNGIPGTLIRGENADLMGHLMAIGDSLRPFTAPNATNTSNPWFGSENYNDAVLTREFRAFADRLILGPSPPPGLRCFGFKEVRYGLDDVDRKLAFLERLYPGAGFIFSVRQTARVAKSGFQREVPHDRLDALFEKFSALGQRPRSHLVRHEDMVGDADRMLADLFAFLDEPLDLSASKAILAQLHSFPAAAPDSLWSNHPFFVRPGDDPTGITMLFVSGLERKRISIVVSGFLRASQPRPLQGLQERSGRALRVATQAGQMRDDRGHILPVVNFLIEIECPPDVDRLEVALADGATLLEMSNLRSLNLRELKRA